MAHAWKASWCNSLTSSNLVSSAIRVSIERSKPFFHADSGLILGMLAYQALNQIMHNTACKSVERGKLVGK